MTSLIHFFVSPLQFISITDLLQNEDVYISDFQKRIFNALKKIIWISYTIQLGMIPRILSMKN